ncbi:MAG: efflux RND transporter periplasmic adaptor subunit [Polyangiaceae bacterium]|nr:efflux RND transporter periplasmic adaptor subunit [Polyangiaceae bacterium]
MPRSRQSRAEGILLLLLVPLGCRAAAQADAHSRNSARPVPVALGMVQRKPMRREIAAVGTVVASATVAVTSQVTGRVDKVHFSEGDEVKQNQVLFTIDPRPYAASLNQARAKLAQNRELARQAEADAQRTASLADAGLAATQELERTDSTAAALIASVAANQAAVQSARIDLANSIIRSPLSGRAGALLVHPGNVVRANAAESPLVVIRRLKPVWVSFSVPDSYLPTIRRSMDEGPVEVVSEPRGADAAPVRGVLRFIANTVDPTTGTIELRAHYPNADETLWPGQQVDVQLELSIEPTATVAPEAAVQLGQQGAYVYIVDKDRRAVLRRVRVDRTVGNEAVIAEGLSPGETVVVDGQLRLSDGVRIEAREPDRAATPRPSADTGGPAPAPKRAP